MKNKIIYRVLNEENSCREYFNNYYGGNEAQFQEFYNEQKEWLESKSEDYLLEHYSHFLYKEELIAYGVQNAS